MSEPEDQSLEALMERQKTLIGAGGNIARRVEIAIQVRLAEKQEVSAEALVKATKQLGTTTSKLVCATWGLVGASVLLVLAEVAFKVARPLMRWFGLSLPH